MFVEVTEDKNLDARHTVEEAMSKSVRNGIIGELTIFHSQRLNEKLS